ncbi:succinate-semialdehyde dehydrogenase, mitochondrial-like [Ornithodoros turicata]|uniref:succinate-semialdehyde dehydrogenase, mitochondrial-like n=1 Tax=Ornithodoros turicata TaxID=34597 RepID=UPI0031399E65
MMIYIGTKMHKLKCVAPLFSSLTRQLTSSPCRQNYALLKEKAFIDDQWKPSEAGATFEVVNPANGQTICSVSDCGVSDVDHAVTAAKDSFRTFKAATAKERSALLRKFFELHTKHSEDLAQLLTAENGKPLLEARGEVAYGGSFLEWFSEEARRIYGDVVPAPVKGREMVFLKQPVGVTAIITPWNFPNAMITRKIGAALAAGCPCVIKPAPDTPLSALALAQLAHEAGFPPGTVNVLPSSEVTTPEVGLRLCEHPDVRALSFTGSSAVGKLLLKQSASTVKKVSLELGGNAPFIVFDSANIGKAVAGAMAAKFRNAGQTCVSANRILVHEAVHDRFLIGMVEAIQEKLVVGDGFQNGTTVGPLINEKAVSKVEHHISDAISKGGKVVLGGKRHPLGGNFFQPTVITGIQDGMLACTEETFGPVASIIKFKTEEEALELANSSRVGLAGYFFSEDISQIWRVAKNLEVGMVGVNEGIISCAEGAFGGIKESGLGREGSRYGTDEFTEIKYICFGGLQ